MYSLLLLFSLVMVQLNAQEGTISTDEQKFLFDYLELTESNLLETVSMVDEESWLYKPKSGGWSLAECMDHIILAEAAVFEQLKEALQSEANAGLNTRNQDGWLISKISDRGVKVVTPLPPQGLFKSKDEMINAFARSRQQIRDFLADGQLPLRSHFGNSPYGPADAYQLALVIAAHSLRHHAQILEVLAEQKTNH